MENVTLGFYRLTESATVPIMATQGSACFDLCADFTVNKQRLISVWDEYNQKSEIMAIAPPNVRDFETNVNAFQIAVPPLTRVLIPTGLIMDIPHGYSVRLHPRSGNAIKRGLTLINSEGVIDSDYVDPVFVPLWNTSRETQVIKTGDRVAQGELIRSLEYNMKALKQRPTATTRAGGFGSTGE